MDKIIEKKIAKIIKLELDSKDFEDTAWLKALKKAKGNDQKAKGLYIEIRTKDLLDNKEILEKHEKELLDVENEYSYNRKKGFVLSKSTPIYKVGKEEKNLFFYSTVCAFKNFANFQGRTPRYQYWFFTLFCTTVTAIATSLDKFILGTHAPFEGVISIIVSLVILVPGISITCRRLNDINKSGWWTLLVLIPIVGIIILLSWALNKSDPSSNKYGKPTNIDVGEISFTDGLFYIILSIVLIIYSAL